MKRLLCHTSVWVSLGMIGCASPSVRTLAAPTPVSDTAETAASDKANYAAVNGTSAVTAVAFQEEGAPTDPAATDPAITPERGPPNGSRSLSSTAS